MDPQDFSRRIDLDRSRGDLSASDVRENQVELNESKCHNQSDAVSPNTPPKSCLIVSLNSINPIRGHGSILKKKSVRARMGLWRRCLDSWNLLEARRTSAPLIPSSTATTMERPTA